MIKDYIFIPDKKEMEKAEERYKERIRKGKTKNCQKYYKKLMKSFEDIRIIS